MNPRTFGKTLLACGIAMVSVAAAPAGVLAAEPRATLATAPPGKPFETAEAVSADRAMPEEQKAALVLGGVGAAGVLTGSFLGLVAQQKWSNSQNACNALRCLDASQAILERNAARDAAKASELSMAIGGVGLVSGIVLWYVSKNRGHIEQSLATARILPLLGIASGAGVSIEGRF